MNHGYFKKSFKTAVLVTTLLAALAGCKKNEESNTYHGKIVNGTSKQVHIDFYATATDYALSTNILKSATIEPLGSWQVPLEFESGTNLYFDWYTSDYAYSNWGNITTFNVAEITPAMDPLMTLKPGLIAGYARKLFLSNNNSQTVWEAYDAMNWGSSQWQTMSAQEKFRRLVFRKDLTGRYYYDNGAGTDSMEFIYSAPTSQSSYFYIQFPSEPFSSSYAFSNFLSSLPSSDSMYTQSYLPFCGNNTYYFRKQ